MSKKAPRVSDRRGFMKQVLGTLAAGMGIALVPRAAFAGGVAQCCKDFRCQPCTGSWPYRCTGCDPFAEFCVCHQPAGTCFSMDCP
jgi:hypothetical protein